MRVRFLLSLALLAFAVWQDAAPAHAASQAIALFTPGIVDGSASGAPKAAEDRAAADALASRVEQALKEKLQDRFDVRLAGPDPGSGGSDARRRRARSIGAAYALLGTVTRVGRSVALDLTLAPVDGSWPGKTVAVSGTDGEPAPDQGKELPFVYRRLVIEAAAKLKLAFFGDESVGEGAARRRLPKLAGTVGRSRPISGDAVSVARGDADRDGKTEIVAGYEDAVVVYGVEGDDLAEKARIPFPGGGIVRVDAADLNRNGIAEIVVARYVSGKAVSDIVEFDGKEYRRTAADVPYFLRAIDLGGDGIVLVGQEPDPSMIFRGPVFRVAVDRGGAALRRLETALPLPAGTWIFGFAPLRFKGTIRYAVVGDAGRLSLLDEKGGRLWDGTDGIAGSDVVVEAPAAAGARARSLAMPNRLFAVDLDGDKTDELLVLNNLVVPGGFFENIRVYAGSEALCFAQDGDHLELAWRTPQIDGASRDSFVVPRRAGSPPGIGVATRDKGKILGRFGEWRVLWLK